MPKKALGSIPALLVLLAAPLAAAPCAPSDKALCLNASRFQVAVQWQDSRGRSGEGQAVSLTGDTGYFWFFSPSNVELVVKVLDARGINGKFWVFFGALSNVQYDLTVNDTVIGASKTYHNPQDQFASVGDTEAFAGSADAPPTNETIAVEGSSGERASLEAVQRFVEGAASRAEAQPCPHPPTALFLNGCRFRVEVSWRDSHGRTGTGHAVSLSDDTGYFWFFTETNVELIVKVLDARSINDRLWVFYGALSNVEYTLSVTDLVSGVVRQYSNALGTFASVGDTGAFSSGFAVRPVTDDTRTATATVDGAGGTLTTTAADGTTYRLEIPEDAIPLPTTIAMTPLSRIDGFPFSGGLRGGVVLQPDGLLLFESASLTIQTPAEIPDAELAPFAYRSGGDEFILYPATRDADGVHFRLGHFSGYGAGAGTAGEHAAQAERTPAGPLGPFVQEAAVVVEKRRTGELTVEEARAALAEIFQRAYDEVILPTLRSVQDCRPSTLLAAFRMALEFLAQLGYIDDIGVSQPMHDGAYAEMKRIALHCVDEAYRICKEEHDLYQIEVMVGIARILGKAGLLDLDEELSIRQKVLKCAHFELDFDATFSLDSELLFTQQRYVADRIPIALEVRQDDQHFIFRGEGPINYDFATFQYKLEPFSLCTVSSATEPGTFHVYELGTDLVIVRGGPGWVIGNQAATLNYEPGEPSQNDSIRCPGQDEHSSGFYSKLPTDWGLFHPSERQPGSNRYFALQWTVRALSSAWATRDWPTRSIDVGGGITQTGTAHMVIRHTPQ